MRSLGRFAAVVLLAVAGGFASCDGPSPVEPVDLTGLTLVLAPQHGAVHWGWTRQFTAVGRRSDGSDVRIPITWSIVSGPGTIDRNGLLTAPGSPTGEDVLVTVRASAGDLSETVTLAMVRSSVPLQGLVVSPNPTFLMPGQSRQFNVVGTDFSSNEPRLPRVTWTVVGGGGSIDSRGFFTAGSSTGEFQIRATAGGVSGVATVTVTNTPPLYIDVPLGSLRSHSVVAATSVTCGSASIAGEVSISPGSSINGQCITTIVHQGDAAAALAQTDASNVYAKLAGLPCTAERLLAETAVSRKLKRGVYCAEGNLTLSGNVELDAQGDRNAVFVLQVQDSLELNANFDLINGTRGTNVYFVVGGRVTMGGIWAGTIVANGDVYLADGSLGFGRVISRSGSVVTGDYISIGWNPHDPDF